MTATENKAVNVHYLDHVMAVAEERAVEATEDIYAENGMKLVAKGYAINSSMRERLIEHKLRKPLEDCMAVSDGVTGPRCAAMAEKLLDQYPVLRAMCLSPQRLSPVKIIADSSFAGRLQTLLTVYAEHQEGKLEHAVCVSLLGMSLAQRLMPGETEALKVLLVAALCHDVGELYIDPRYLVKGARLESKEWRHIAAHPIIAHSLLKDLTGLAKPASALVLDHHERLDGFGYPQGRRAGQVSDSAQVLALAEMLGGMMDRGGAVLQQADVAVKLIHGEFSRPVIDVVSRTFQECRSADAPPDLESVGRSLKGSSQLAGQLQRVLEIQSSFSKEFERGSPAFKAVWIHAQERFASIVRAWSSTGLDVQPEGTWLTSEAPETQLEASIIMREIFWRLRELEREMRVRILRSSALDLPMLERYFEQARQALGINPEPKAPAADQAKEATPV